MRARYCAHATQEPAFLANSWHPDTRPPGSSATSTAIQWAGLVVESVRAGGPEDDRGEVTFTAHFVLDGRRGAHRERSTFVRHDGSWVYLDGEDLTGPAGEVS